jgi:transposase
MHVEDRLPLAELQRLERLEKNSSKARRIRIVILAIQGYTAPAIAMSVGLSRRICQRWVYRYNKLGFKGLEDLRKNHLAGSLTPEQQTEFKKRLEAGPKPEDKVCTLRGSDFQRILKEEFGVVRTLSHVYNLLHQLGYSCLKPRPKHYKSDVKKQEEFIKALPNRLKGIAQHHPNKTLRIYFEDESRFGQQGSITKVWATKGSRPTVIRQTEFQYLWVLGAVCPETGHAEGLISPCLNTDVINAFLKQFSAEIKPDEHAVLIWDQAGFHTSKKLQVPENITIIELPPYSPELNPAENLWHYFKEHAWGNQYYKDYKALENKAIESWRNIAMKPELMKTVCAAPYVKRATSE